MKISRVTDSFAVAPQLSPSDLGSVADEGFAAVICNRPDGEEAGQPAADVMRRAAEEAGLSFHHIPVTGGAFPEAAIDAFGKVRRETNGPVLAYCRSGTRSIMLDALSNADDLSAQERIENARQAGYDLSPLRDRLGG
ncbi:TIGR01244 family sulfur transferase [Porphyrobacter sp. GA68]|uniref:TIGR01244 family sulfur transferase n=1 Tax=Porphyrobacter sp. GA68 TaxID=2883480 RepID=UPI001D17DDCD|nr:TIGR01244 family sulfur transferase [Porphyrobacter sp. GA68]